jgi:hypothetical protein
MDLIQALSTLKFGLIQQIGKTHQMLVYLYVVHAVTVPVVFPELCNSKGSEILQSNHDEVDSQG